MQTEFKQKIYIMLTTCKKILAHNLLELKIDISKPDEILLIATYQCRRLYKIPQKILEQFKKHGIKYHILRGDMNINILKKMTTSSATFLI